MERAKKALIYSLILLPVVLVFKNLFDTSNPLVWGDAPYFYPENLKELFNIPYVWDIRNNNFGSPQFLTLWLYIPTFLLGMLHELFGLNHEIAIRMVFYFQFLICGSLGVYLLLRRFNFSNLARVFGVLLYTLNTYSLVLIDGGQIGVMLSYGLFPLVLVAFFNFLDNCSSKNFVLATLSHFVIFNTDLRIALILLLFETAWLIFLSKGEKFKKFLRATSIYIVTLALCSFWILPFFAGLNKSGSGALQDTEDFILLSHSFYLFQPHFPYNDFGNLSKTPVYFIFLPVIILLGLIKKNRQTLKLTFLFLFFIFLSKGSNPPFGEIYDFVVNNVSLGSAFRDSSKFYIPSILIACILVANSYDFIKNTFRKSKFIWLFTIYFTLIVTIYPALVYSLGGVLGKNPNRGDFNEIYTLIKTQNSSFRTLWFKERPSFGFSDWNHPAISANLLFKERPFATMIDGDYDLFGFLHSSQISKWYELLGIKYIFYPPYEREKSLTRKEQMERRLFEDFISKIPGLKKINLSISFQAYETGNPMPKIFGQEKVLFVIGGEEVYEKLFSIKNFSLEKAGIVFLESCKFDSKTIFNLKPESFGFLLSRDKNDLLLAFFCDEFISPESAINKQWAVNNSSEYLNWKSQLLERGIRNYDYDFNKGLAYSTKENEKLEFKINVPETKSYYLPLRFLTSTESAGLKVNYKNDEVILKSSSAHKLEWSIIGPVFLERGETLIRLTNQGGVVALNTIALISQDAYEQNQYKIDDELSALTFLNPDDTEKLENWFHSSFRESDFKLISPVKYTVRVPEDTNWLVFSERFDKDWNLHNNSINKPPLPFYSMINGFYVGDVPDGNYEIYYQHQKKVEMGILLSLAAFLSVCFGVILHIISKGRLYEIITKYFRSSKN